MNITLDWIKYLFPLISIPFMAFLPPAIIKRKRAYYKEKRKKELTTYLSDKKRAAVRAGSVIAFAAAGCLKAYTSEEIWTAVLFAVIYACCAMVMQIDADVRIIPNELLLSMLLAAAAGKIIDAAQAKSGWGILYSVIAMVIVFELLDKVVNTISRLFGAQAIGMGDIKLMSLMTFLYWGNMDQMTGWLLGFAVSIFAVLIPMLLMKKISKYSFFAFGPYITAGAVGEAVYTFIRFVR